MKSLHIPVLSKELINYLKPKRNQNFIDCTIGGAGHAQKILERNGPEGKLLGIDLDQDALRLASEILRPYRKRVTLVLENFGELSEIVAAHKFKIVRGILFDLGMSSIALERSGRGFSFRKDESLDMRFDQRTALTASQIVNNFSEKDLVKILRDYGQEPQARRIAQAIVARRKSQEIQTSFELSDIIIKTLAQKTRRERKTKKTARSRVTGRHPATRVFQALRIFVNNELENLRKALPQALEVLEPGGRLVIISFHSLEDRIVKNFFRMEARGCHCPPDLPVCRCGHTAQIKIFTRRPIQATQKEIKQNPRARSAKLRAAQKL